MGRALTSRRAGTLLDGREAHRPVLRAIFRAYLVLVVAATALLPFLLAGTGHAPCQDSEVLTGLALVLASVLNVEIGRVVEGGVVGSQRPHKALSAWAFASALLLPTWWLLPVVAITYAHAWWRGLRVSVLKWIGSGCYLVLSGVTAAVVSSAIAGRDMDLMYGDGRRGLLAVLVSAVAFLAVETVLFHGSAYLNRPASEVWLRRTLRSRSFYLTESAVLVLGGLSAAIWTGGPWILVLLIPVYGLAQRAALHVPLRERADHDEKTGLLRFDVWRHGAAAAVERCLRRRRAWSVLFVDIDHFKRFNDARGHLAGDEALALVAREVVEACGERALVGRFGGEEFCAFLERDLVGATETAERLRSAVAALALPGPTGADGADGPGSGETPGGGLTVSVGLAVVEAERDVELSVALEYADRALFSAKDGGRNATAVRVVTG